MSVVLPIAAGLRDRVPARAPSVRFLVEQFLGAKELEHRGGLVGPALLARYRLYLGSFADAYGDLDADGCRGADVSRWILGRPSWKSDHTRQDAARSVVTLFRWAADEAGVLDRNPLGRLKPCWHTPRPRGAIKPGEYAEIMRLARSCDGRGRRRRPSRGVFRKAVYFLWETGARTCEMRAATWEDLDWERGLLVLTKNKTAHRTGQPRLIALGARVLRLLRWERRRRQPRPEERIFLSSRGTPWTKDTFGKLFRKYADLAGVRRSVTAYTLRHGFTVQGLENDVGERQLADALGQTSTRYVGWYGRDVRAKSEYLRAVNDQVHGRRKRR